VWVGGEWVGARTPPEEIAALSPDTALADLWVGVDDQVTDDQLLEHGFYEVGRRLHVHLALLELPGRAKRTASYRARSSGHVTGRVLRGTGAEAAAEQWARRG
jgi:hypothetical protein